MDEKYNELARAKDETKEKMKTTKDQYNSFWQGFLEKRKNKPRGSVQCANTIT
jgi:hypothetical protein